MRILIVEDERPIAELERDYLEMEGFQVEIAEDGPSGLAAAMDPSVDLVILDLMLPGLDGFSLLRELRTKRDIPVILLSAKQEEVDKIRGLGLGADDYVTKPFGPQELVARVKAHLRRYGKQADGGIIAFGELRIDPSSRRVFVDDREAILTNKEFELLQLLAEHPDHVFSKERIFERLWGLEAAGDLATVPVHIRRIREKIEKNPADPQYIETLWGAGYRFRKR